LQGEELINGRAHHLLECIVLPDDAVCQSEWISMTSGDLAILSLGGKVSWDDSTTLVSFAKAFEMLSSWSSCRKTPVGTMARLEPTLANSFATPIFSSQDMHVLKAVKIIF
jgi:hypothetical protein